MKIQNKKSPKSIKTWDTEAKFWEDNFDSEWDKAKPAKANVSPNIANTLSLAFKPSTLKSVKQAAQKMGIEPDQLIHRWVKEKLTQTNYAR